MAFFTAKNPLPVMMSPIKFLWRTSPRLFLQRHGTA